MHYKKLRAIGWYSFGFAILNSCIDAFLLGYTDSNQIDISILEVVRNFQITLAIITILLPLLFLINKKRTELS